jgi:crossover junction endodeoxyribonuclease RuvC
MRVLGIDPGTVVAGYGVIDNNDGRVVMVSCGALTAQAKLQPAQRLSIIYKQIEKIVAKYKPDVVAVETPFVGANIISALAIGKAQALALLAAANKNIPVFEYSPAKVKQRVTGYGAGSKDQVQQMVRLELGLTEFPYPTDAADALAVALCHLSENHLEQLTGPEPKTKKRRAV